MKRAIVIAVIVALFVPFYTHAKKKRVPPSTSPYTIIINENGIDSIWLGAVQLASGGTQLVDGSWFYLPNVFREFEPTITAKSASTSGGVTTVNHTYSGALTAHVVYTYRSSNGDISVQAAVTNLGSQPITIPAFRTPFFRWDNASAVQSNGLGFDQSHTQHYGINLSYPSVNVRFAATYATGMAAGGFPLNFCTWSQEDPFLKFMTISYGRFGVTGIAIGNFFFESIPAGESRTYKFGLRFSASSDWKVLMQPYRDQLRASFPTVAYETDARPMAQFASINVAYVRPDNPYGYNDGNGASCATTLCRRFDKLEGCQGFIDRLVPPMVATNYQGIIFWQPQGINPRGVQYRPDFDNFPPEVSANLPILVNGFRNAGLRVGLLSRPMVHIVPSSPTTDGTDLFASLDDAVADIQTRLAWALGKGINAFYLDSFMNEGYDHGLMRGIRDAIGDIPTFTEHSTALSMAFSGAYEQLGYVNGTYVSDKYLAILRWLYPESIVLVKFTGSLPPGGYAELYSYMFSNRFTPLIEDFRIQSTAPGSENSILQPLVQTYIDSNNQWRLGAIRADANPRQRSTNRQVAVNRGIAVDRQ